MVPGEFAGAYVYPLKYARVYPLKEAVLQRIAGVARTSCVCEQRESSKNGAPQNSTGLGSAGYQSVEGSRQLFSFSGKITNVVRRTMLELAGKVWETLLMYKVLDKCCRETLCKHKKGLQPGLSTVPRGLRGGPS